MKEGLGQSSVGVIGSGIQGVCISLNLIKKGFIQRTPRGRVALEKTYKYLGRPIKNNNQQKFI